MRNTSFAVEVVLGQILPSLRARYEIRETLRAGLQGKPPLSRLQNLVNGENWTINASANLAPRNLAFTGRVTEVEHQRTLSSRFKVHRVNDAAARRIVDLAAANHIRVFLLIPPFAPELHARCQVTGADRLHDAFVQSLQARSPGLTVLDARGSGYPSSVFVDPSHLDAQGTVALSRDVAGVLKHDLNTTAAPADRGRWIALPAFREPAANLALENVEQTLRGSGLFTECLESEGIYKEIPMRIAWFTHRYHPCIGGAETYGRAMVRRFVASGHAVDVFTSDAEDLWYFTDRKRRRIDQPRIAIVDGATVRRFPVRHLPLQRYFGRLLSYAPHWPTRCRSASYMPIIPGIDRVRGDYDAVVAVGFPYTVFSYAAFRTALPRVLR